MSLDLDPTEREAKRLITGLVGYWGAFAAASWTWPKLVYVLSIPALALFLLFYRTVVRIVSRETGRPVAVYFNPIAAMRSGEYWALTRESFEWQLKLMSPRWLSHVARKTGWSTRLVGLALVTSLGLALLGISRLVSQGMS